MRLASRVSVGVVAALHVAFLVLEMFLWATPFGQKTFALTPDFAQASKTLAANQGLYNGFLAAGLVWGLLSPAGGRAIQTFFLICIIIAGIYGGLTAKISILFIQAAPAAIALALVRTTARDA